jgi:cytochrome P450
VVGTAKAAYIPFSGGARNCVGKRFAVLESTVLLSVLVRDLNFTPVGGYEMIPEHTGVVQRPKGEMPMKVACRMQS